MKGEKMTANQTEQREPMNTHTYVDGSADPVVSAVSETLSDGSRVWNLIIHAQELGCANETQAKLAADEIAEVLRKYTLANVLTL